MPYSRRVRAGCLIFDLDGTLWDTNAACAEGWNRVLLRLGVQQRKISEADIRGICGMPHRAAVGHVLAGLDESLLDEISRQTAREDIAVIAERGGTLFAGVSEWVPRLAERWPLMIVSNCQAGYIELFREQSGLDACFLDHECWGNTGRAKTDNLAAVVQRNRAPAPVFIGDTAGDHEAARDNALPFIHAAYGFGAVADADAVLERFADLPALLAR
jgi:phosphoglycolate phosphatase